MTQVMQTTYPYYRELVPYWLALVGLGEGIYSLALLLRNEGQEPCIGVEGEIAFITIQDRNVLAFDVRGNHA